MDFDWVSNVTGYDYIGDKSEVWVDVDGMSLLEKRLVLNQLGEVLGGLIHQWNEGENPPKDNDLSGMGGFLLHCGHEDFDFESQENHICYFTSNPSGKPEDVNLLDFVESDFKKDEGDDYYKRRVVYGGDVLSGTNNVNESFDWVKTHISDDKFDNPMVIALYEVYGAESCEGIEEDGECAYGNGVKFINDEFEEFCVVHDEEIEDSLRRMHESFINSEGYEGYGDSLIGDFVYMSDTDIRLFARDESVARSEGYDFEDLTSSLNKEDVVLELSDEIEEIEEEIEELEDLLLYHDEDEDEELDEDSINNKISELKTKLKTKESDYEDLESEFREEYEEMISDEIEEELDKDPVSYFLEQGTYENVGQLIRYNVVMVNERELLDYLVSVSEYSELSTYDGEIGEFGDYYTFRES